MSDPNVMWNEPLATPPPATSPDVNQRIAQQVAASPGYQVISPPLPRQIQTRSPVLNKILAGMSAFNKGFMAASPSGQLAQLAPWVKNTEQESEQSSEGLREQNPIAAKIGGGAGVLASAISPSPAGPPLSLPGVASNAIAVSPYSVLAAIKEPGTIVDKIKKGLETEALSVGGSTLLQGVAKGVSRLIPGIRKAIINQSLSGDIGIQGRQFAQNLKGIAGGKQPGSIINRAGPLKEEIIDLANSTKGTPLDISTETGKINFVNEVDKRWDDQVDQAFNQFRQQGGKLSDLSNSIYANPRIQETINAHPELIDKLDNIISTASKTADIQGMGAARKYLRDQVINLGSRAGASDDAYLAGKLGEGVHDVVDEHFVPQELKETYGRDKLIKQVLAADVMKIPKAVKSGSETAARLLAHGAMTAGGALIPGIGIPMAAVGVGGIVNDIASGLINKGLGKLATRIAPHLGPMTGEAVASAAQNLPGATARMIGAGEDAGASGTGAMDLLSGPTNPTGGRFSPQAQAATPGPVAPVPIPPAGAQPIPNQPIPGPEAPAQIPGATPGAQPIPLATPQLTPQEQAQVDFRKPGQPQPVSTGFKDSEIQARLDEKYNRYVRQYGSDYTSRQQYEEAARRATHNFDPMLPNTWKAMFDDPETSEKLYKGYLNLQKISDVDPAAALNHYTRLLHFGQRISPEAQRQEDQDNAKLVQALSDMTGQSIKAIDDRLRQIAWDKGKTPEERQQMVLDMIVKEGGVDVPLLARMGLW